MRKTGLIPDLWQATLLRSSADRLLVLTTRQAGKSQTVAALALRTALLVPRSLVLLLSPSERQSGELAQKTFGYYDGLGKPVPPRHLTAGVPRALETVCLKCLHKEPYKRYQSAAELAEDLARFEQGEPVRARPAGLLERAWRWCKRNPTVASLLALVTLLFVTGTTVSMLFAFDAAAQAAIARQKAEDAEENARKAGEAEGRASKRRGWSGGAPNEF